MTTYESNAAVKSGYYFNTATMALVPVERDGGRLPNENGSWIAVPTAAALLLTPILGAMFAFFLPALGFLLVGEATGKRLAAAFATGAGEIVSAGYAPGMAHLTGKEPGEAKGEPKTTPALEQIEKEIEQKRK